MEFFDKKIMYFKKLLVSALTVKSNGQIWKLGLPIATGTFNTQSLAIKNVEEVVCVATAAQVNKLFTAATSLVVVPARLPATIGPCWFMSSDYCNL